MESLTHSNFVDLTYQASIISIHPEFVSYKILSNLLNKWEKTLDAEPEILPEFPRLPNPKLDIPSLILKSKNDEWRLEFSSTRMNIFWNKLLDGSNDFRIDLFPNFVFHYVNEVVALFQPKISRLAFVAKRHFNINDPGVVLAKHFCKEEFTRTKALNNSHNFEIHSHKVYTHAPLPAINSWFRCKTVDIQFSGGPKRSIFIEQDINTLSENMEKNQFSISSIRSFYEGISSEMQKIMTDFFPSPTGK